MIFYTNIISKRNLNGSHSYSRIKIDSEKEFTDIIPKKKDILKWAIETAYKVRLGLPPDIIHIKVKRDFYEEIVKKLYRKIGKEVSIEEELQFRIPLKRNKSYFFEEINQIELYSEELGLKTIVIHI